MAIDEGTSTWWLLSQTVVVDFEELALQFSAPVDSEQLTAANFSLSKLGSPVELRAGAAGGGKQLLAHRVVDHGVLESTLLLHSDRDRKYREAMQIPPSNERKRLA